MPTYDYECQACGHRMEAFQSIKDNPLRKCPECKRLKLKRLIGAGAGLIFKGSGFYITDYRSDSYKEGKKSDSSSSSSESKKTDSKSKSKGSSGSAKGKSGGSSSGKAPKKPGK